MQEVYTLYDFLEKKRISLFPQQFNVIKSRKKYIYLCGGKGTGKTAGSVMRIYYQCLVFRDQKIFVGAAGEKTMDELFIAEWERRVPKSIWKRDKKRNIIFLPKFNSYLFLWYINHDTKKRIKGVNYSGYYICQPEEIPDRVLEPTFSEIEDRTRIYESEPFRQLRLLDGNPGAPGSFLHRMFIDKSSDNYVGENLIDLINVRTTPETSVYSKSTIEQKIRTLPKWMVQRDIYGEWVAAEGRVYPDYTEMDFDSTKLVKYHIGLDLGIAQSEASFAVVFVGELQSGQCIVFREDLFKWAGSENAAQRIDNLIEAFGVEKLGKVAIGWDGDSIRKDLVKNSKHIKQIWPPSSNIKWKYVMAGWAKLNEAFVNKKLVINFSNDCINIRKDLANYVWAENGEPDKKRYNAHMLDALRYIWIRRITGIEYGS